ncbi:dihydrofolate reductase [Scheffersomyces coipomensis]|uniref:dihydrofolate reductase n=1 Tax=Scheffersomyces coipomensis TaxID=1788519 RepID=UPI00315DE9E3
MTTDISKPTISIIVAALKPNLGIGYQGKLPWRLRKEIKYFKDITTQVKNHDHINAVIMGRRTWDSIPNKFKPLPNRINVVLSRSFKNEIIDSNVIHANSIDVALNQLSNKDQLKKSIERIFIIGGAEIYNELIHDSRIDHLLITEVENSNKDHQVPIDTFLNFPIYDSNNNGGWIKSSKSELQEFAGDDISIEDDIKEGDFVYNYTLWKRK